jgi:replicative DNA helicase
MSAHTALAFEKGLPSNVEAERYVLGSILMDDSQYIFAAGVLEPDDFSLEKHRRIFLRMGEMNARGDRIDRITLANELIRFNELEACGGVSYLVSLDDGLPQIFNLDGYIKIVKEKSVLRRIVFTSQHLMNRALMGEEDADTILAGAEETLLKLGESRAKAGLVSPREVIDEYQGGLNAFLDPSKRVKGLSTGFYKLDEMTGGLHPGELIILAARPSMGKTAMALNIAAHAASQLGKVAAVFSLEMSKESLLTRMLCATARVDSQRFRAGYLNQEERRNLQRAAAKLVEAPLYIDDTAGSNVMDIHAKLRRLKSERGALDLVIVDYLQLMSGRGRFENRNAEVSALSRGLKLLAKELNVPMLVLSQLSRAPETRQGDHRPQLSDLRESGCLCGDALVAIPCSGKRVPMSQLAGSVGFPVWALNESTYRLERTPVQRAFSTGRNQTYRLQTALGRSIRATANHRFRTFAGWKRLDELKVGDHLAVPRRMPGGSAQTISDRELALLGHLIGDGCTLPRHVQQYTTREYELADLVAGLAAAVFEGRIEPRISQERRWYQVYLTSTRAHTHGVHSALAEWLGDLGIFGLRSYEKRAPDRVFEQPPEAVAVFLRHLWSTDGCINLRRAGERRIPIAYYATSSERLAEGVQALLLQLGINARLKRVPQVGKGRDQFHVSITGKPDIQRFATVVGAVGERRRRQLEQVTEYLAGSAANTNRDIIPRTVWRDLALPAMRRAGMTTRQMAAALDTAYCGTSIYKQNLGRERALRLGRVVESPEILALAESEVYWDTVAGIEKGEVEEVFDLTVPKLHNFVAANIIVHNSIEQDADLVGFIFREEVYKREREDLRGIAELIVGKQRNGPVGIINLVYLHSLTKFENRAEDLGDVTPE